MSELSDFKRSVDELRDIIVNHVTESKIYMAEANAYRKEKDRIIEAIKDTLWDNNGEPGIATKIDRLIQIESQRKWTIRAIATAIFAGITDRLFHLLPK